MRHQFGDKLKALRMKTGLTQEQVGERLGYSKGQFVHNFEKGKAFPALSKFKKISKLYGIPTETLVEWKIKTVADRIRASVKP